jgi:hypothetical protein
MSVVVMKWEDRVMQGRKPADIRPVIETGRAQVEMVEEINELRALVDLLVSKEVNPK